MNITRVSITPSKFKEIISGSKDVSMEVDEERE
jgi:hypothetical protein